MIKVKWVGYGAIVAVGVAAAASLAFAQSTTALSVSCSGTVSNTNQIIWSATTTGGNAPYSFVWSGTSINSSTASTTTGTYSTNGAFAATIMATDASSTSASSSCSQSITGIVSTPTSTPPAPRVNPPSLSIGANGSFLARGMTVTSVASTSFQAQVWGITYTVNWSGSLSGPLEFFFRFNQATTTPSNQVQVGDEVGVSGMVSNSSPMTVNANIVRDYSIAAPRPVHTGGTDNGIGNGGQNNGNGNGNNQGNDNGQGNGNGNGSSSSDVQGKLNGLLQQLQKLEGLFGNGNGNSNSGNH